MPFYYGNSRGNTIPAASSSLGSPSPTLVYDFVLRRTHCHLLYDTATGDGHVRFQDYGVLETRKTKVLRLSILDHPIALRAHVFGVLADMNVDPVPVVWERMAQDVLRRAGGLAQQHDRTCSIIVKAYLEIRTVEDVCLSSRSTSESTRQRLVETAFKIGSDDPEYDDLDDSCSVCLDELRGEMELIKTPCDHIFHKGCIIRWLENGKSCPLCRFEFE